MKAIIKGKKYDTDTATQIGEIQIYDGQEYTDVQSELIRRYACRDNFRFFVKETEGLFRKSDGEYFLAQKDLEWEEDVPMLDFVLESMEDPVKPLTAEEAKAWAERYLRTEIYESEFGEVPE